MKSMKGKIKKKTSDQGDHIVGQSNLNISICKQKQQQTKKLQKQRLINNIVQLKYRQMIKNQQQLKLFQQLRDVESQIRRFGSAQTCSKQLIELLQPQYIVYSINHNSDTHNSGSSNIKNTNAIDDLVKYMLHLDNNHNFYQFTEHKSKENRKQSSLDIKINKYRRLATRQSLSDAVEQGKNKQQQRQIQFANTNKFEQQQYSYLIDRLHISQLKQQQMQWRQYGQLNPKYLQIYSGSILKVLKFIQR